MKESEFIQLKQHCFEVVKKAVDLQKDIDLSLMFSEQWDRIEKLPDTEDVRNTFKGIIGYNTWLHDKSRPKDGFVWDVLHDLTECERNYMEEWYSPRTNPYVKYYKPKVE